MRRLPISDVLRFYSPLPPMPTADAGGHRPAGERPAESQYCVFRSGRERFCLPVLDVEEGAELTILTRLPLAPPYLMVIFNLRGAIVPLIDIAMTEKRRPGPASQARGGGIDARGRQSRRCAHRNRFRRGCRHVFGDLGRFTAPGAWKVCRTVLMLRHDDRLRRVSIVPISLSRTVDLNSRRDAGDAGRAHRKSLEEMITEFNHLDAGVLQRAAFAFAIGMKFFDAHQANSGEANSPGKPGEHALGRRRDLDRLRHVRAAGVVAEQCRGHSGQPEL